jgi:SAM-dependent methyltransferase
MAASLRHRLRHTLVSAALGPARQNHRLVGVAIGLLRLADLRDGLERFWSGFYNSDREIDQGLFDWEQELINQFVRPSHRVLVIGCGTGRDVVPLASMGCDVVGIEPARAAARRARRTVAERHVSATILDGYYEDLAVPGAFDVIVFSFLTYGYIPGNRRRIESLLKAKAHLAPHGCVLVSYTEVPTPPASLRIARTVGWLCWSDWLAEEGDVVYPQAEDKGFFGFEHWFVREAIDREVAAAGLDVLFRREPPEQPVLVLGQRSPRS